MYQLVKYEPKGPWNKGKLIRQKTPLKLKDIWTIRIKLEMSGKTRDLALFNLALDTKLRACDFTKLKVSDISHSDQILNRAMIMQQKAQAGGYLGVKQLAV